MKAAFLAILAAASAAAPRPEAIDPGSWITDADYPVEAQRRQIGGTVGYRLWVDAAGRATRCEVTAPAAPILDERTCEILLERSRFRPARDERGNPVPAVFSSRIVWRIPDHSQAGADPHLLPLAPWRTSFDVSLAAPEGDCRFEAVGPVPLFFGGSPCSVFIRGGRLPPSGRLTVRMSQWLAGAGDPWLAEATAESVESRRWTFDVAPDGSVQSCVLAGEHRSVDWAPLFGSLDPCLHLQGSRFWRPDKGGGTISVQMRATVYLEPGGQTQHGR